MGNKKIVCESCGTIFPFEKAKDFTVCPVCNASFDDETAVLKSGVIIRHLVLPGMRKDSIALLQHLSGNLNREDYILSLMSQFTPHYRCGEFKEINRRVTRFEYDSVVNKALELGLDQTYIQDRASAGEEYTPSFCLEGC